MEGNEKRVRARQYRSALVLGIGVSGRAAAALLAEEGVCVTAIDAARGDEVSARAAQIREQGVTTILGSNGLPEGRFDLCVVSPGVPADATWVTEAAARGCELISELELGARRCRVPMIAITGSNGKSTLVSLCRNMLEVSGARAIAAGNIGTPLCEAIHEPADWLVVEVSSFQLEHVSSFHPRIGVLLNIQPDHLDRHHSLTAYAAAKARLFDAMEPGDCGIVLASVLDDIRALAKGRNRWLGLGPGGDYVYAAGRVQGPSGRTVNVAGTSFDNPILGVAAAAALAVADACGIEADVLEAALGGFTPLPHRMQEVARRSGVRYIDDSKATNLAAMAAGIAMAGDGVRLVAGGHLKEKDLDFPKEVLATRVRKVYLIGEAAGAMASAWEGIVECLSCSDLETAVRTASGEAEPGETVLLSPGCASFDQFRNYRDRGEQFTRIAKALSEEQGVSPSCQDTRSSP